MSIDPRVDIGHVHLKVSDIDRALSFYRDILGFEVMQRLGDQAAFVSAGGYHHHLGLNTWESSDGSPPPPGTTGLYHVAVRYPNRRALGDALRRLLEARWPIDGATDHGVSEAIYLRDPDQNGIEIYRDRPEEDWPRPPNGDGMQLAGGRFTSETALVGNDLSTLPDFPAEIRAPAGSLPGVSGFQLHFADHDILTPGDAPDVLVAMNPAALKTNLRDLPKGGTLIVNRDAFTERNLEKAGYLASPLEDGSLDEYHLHEVPLTTLTLEALKDIDVTKREAERSKNMFALGLMSWLYHRPTEATVAFLETKFKSKPAIAEANVKAFKAGWAYGETSEDFVVSYEVAPAKLPPGTYRNITGNPALRLGLIAASVKSGLPLFLGAYPITPASEILEHLSRYKRFGVRTFQAEDEIAAVGAALGASFGGALGVCTSSGPGIALKSETVGLAVALELPLLILDIQRAGPSTGMPTKPEQADLLMVLFGRNAESPVPVVAAATPGGCFDAALEAARIALKYRTPVYLLSDAYLANGSEPRLLPHAAALPGH